MFNKILDSIEEIICIICTIVMVCITFANVVCRWTGIGSLAFSEEIATYLFILLSMMGTAIAAKRRAHLGLTILPDAVNFKARKALLVFVYGLCTVFMAVGSAPRARKKPMKTTLPGTRIFRCWTSSGVRTSCLEFVS